MFLLDHVPHIQKLKVGPFRAVMIFHFSTATKL